jgi:hypothetical protein
MVFAAFAALAFGILIVVIRAITGILYGGWAGTMSSLLGTAVLTGLIGPFVFRSCRLVDSRFSRTPRERDAAATGFL